MHFPSLTSLKFYSAVRTSPSSNGGENPEGNNEGSKTITS